MGFFQEHRYDLKQKCTAAFRTHSRLAYCSAARQLWEEGSSTGRGDRGHQNSLVLSGKHHKPKSNKFLQL